MPRGKKEMAEQIIPYAASVEVEVVRGKTVIEAIKKIGVTEHATHLHFSAPSLSRPTSRG